MRMSKATHRMRSYAKRMRRAPTRGEDRLWNWLRNRRFSGVKFRRQHPFGRTILDFYCPALRLAIEIDGAQHLDSRIGERDYDRDYDLKRLGVTIVRIPNELLRRDSWMVERIIVAAIERCRLRL